MVLREQGPRGRLRTVDIEAVMSAPDERDQHFGAGALEDLSWKDVLDLYTCTECGRCQSHCPAYLTGKPLSPKTLITDLREVADERLRGGYAASRHSAHVDVSRGSGSAAPVDRTGDVGDRRGAGIASAGCPAASSRPGSAPTG